MVTTMPPQLMSSEKLRMWRAKYRLSQHQLAEALGVNVRTIGKWENAERAIPPFMELALEGLEQRRRNQISAALAAAQEETNELQVL